MVPSLVWFGQLKLKQESKMTENQNRGKYREQLIQAVLKKRNCNAKAHRIVEEFSLELRKDKSDFLSKLNDIQPSHYDDIVDERHVQKFCGYPICDRILESIPTNQYRINMAQNKVYDITERKKFCSGFCFKASGYIKAQIPTTPLWIRDIEPTPQFELLDNN